MEQGNKIYLREDNKAILGLDKQLQGPMFYFRCETIVLTATAFISVNNKRKGSLKTTSTFEFIMDKNFENS